MRSKRSTSGGPLARNPAGDFPLRSFDVLTSTNDSILAAGETDAPEGTIHLCREQTRGRGRGDHRWWSPSGAGLWMSTLLRPRGRREAWGGLSLLAGAAVQATLQGFGARGVELIWPNDLEVKGRKLGGILCEVRSRGNRSWIALGIGVNLDLTPAPVRDAMPAALREKAICMVEAGSPSVPEPATMARAVVGEFWPLYRRFLDGEDLPEIVGERLAVAGRRVSVKLPSAVAAFRGTVERLGRGGELLVRDARGEVVPVIAAEVTYE